MRRSALEKDLPEGFLSKLFDMTETSVGEIQNENQVLIPPLIQIIDNELKKNGFQAREEGQQKSSEETSPEACPRSFGYLRTLPRNDPIPDECLICIKVMQCMSRHTT